MVKELRFFQSHRLGGNLAQPFIGSGAFGKELRLVCACVFSFGILIRRVGIKIPTSHKVFMSIELEWRPNYNDIYNSLQI